MSAKDYPEHLNPFDENYNGVVENSNKEKYHTWSSARSNQVNTLVKPKPTSLEKPWTVLNISPKNKVVRKLSILKKAVEQFASKKTKLSHSTSVREGSTAVRSHSLHDEFSFRIISPKVKEKIRQQAFSRAVESQNNSQAESSEILGTSQHSGRLSLPLKTEEVDLNPQNEDSFTASPQDLSPVKDNPLGARPKARKKRPPPPPPPGATDQSKPTNLITCNRTEGLEDSHSVNSSITQDLEKDASSGEDNSLT